MILSSWFDRPLSLAGRAVVRTDAGVKTVLVNIDRDLLVIPSLAIHMTRGMADQKLNPQVDLLPLFGDERPTTRRLSPRRRASRRRTCSRATCSSTRARRARSRGRRASSSWRRGSTTCSARFRP